MTVLLEPPPVAAVAAPPRRGSRLLPVLLATVALALLGVAAVRAAPALVQVAPLAPQFAGTAPQVTLPTYGLRGMHVVGYEHGATAELTLPVRNDGRLPVTVTSVDLGGGVAPLLGVQRVEGLPLALGAGETGTVVVHAVLGNCEYFHEREVQHYPAVEVGLRVLGRDAVRTVPYDRPLMVHAPMIVGCPDRLLDRQAQDRKDLTDAA